MRYVRMLLCSVALTLPIAALARAPYTPPGAGDAMLRFAWRMNVTARENCRTRTAEELARLPVHMRTPEICTRDAASYSLITRIGAATPDTVQLTRGGVRGDRPLFVLEQRKLPPGRHRVRIALHRVTATNNEVLGELDTVLTLRRGDIQLVTLDAAGELTARSSTAGP